MDDQQQKTLMRDTFNAVANGYDHPALRFFPDTANRLVSLLGLSDSVHVLDVATGTGNAALVLAKALPKGRVTGVDFSPAMLDQARKKAEASGIENVHFVEGDMQALDFPGRPFDAAICSFGIFFVEDMAAQLSHIATTVRPGGRIAITSFGANYFYPLKDKLLDRLSRYGVPLPPPTWRRVATEAGCVDLFERAGLGDVAVTRENMGYWLSGPEDWWNVVWNAGYRRMVSQFSPEDLERFRQEHLEEVEALRTSEGIRLDVDVLFTMGTVKEVV